MSAHRPIKASTQEHLNVEDIRDDIAILKDGSCCLVLRATAINFGLLSEAEQDAIIYAYAGLLNSLSFPTQITIRSKRKDISSYLNLLSEQEKKIKKPALKEQLKKYRAFVEETVKKNEVLDKKFYISIPFSTLELGITSTLSQTLKPKKGLPYPKSHILEKAKTHLYPKRDHLIRQLNRLGLKSKQLNTQELLELFYNIYNPESMGQTLVSAKDYKASLVEPAIAGEKPEEREKSMDFPAKKPVSGKDQATKPAAPGLGGVAQTPPTPPAGQAQVPKGPAAPSPQGTAAQAPPIIKSDEDAVPSAPTGPARVGSTPAAGTTPVTGPGGKNIQAEIDKAAQQVGSGPAPIPSPTAVPSAPPSGATPPADQTKTE